MTQINEKVEKKRFYFNIYNMFERNLVKLLKAINLLAKPLGCSIKELATSLLISRRSVYRLLDTLQELNFPIYDEKLAFSREKRWKLEESYLKKLPNIDIPRITFSANEIIFLHYLLSKVSTLKCTEFGRVINSISKKLGLFFPEQVSSKLSFDKLESIFITDKKYIKEYSGKEEIINILIDGLIHQKTCLVTYHSFNTDKSKKYRIDPLKIFEHQGGLYAFVNVTRFKTVRMLAIERVLEIKQLDDNFTYPEDFDANKLLESAFKLTLDDPIEVKIWFSKDQARYIEERQWAVEQKIKKQYDGSLILTIKTSGVFDVKKWVMSFGADAVVLEPLSLKENISAELIRMNKNY